MKIAIVGTSHLGDDEIESAMVQIETIIERARQKNDTIITGDADGVDKLVRTFSLNKVNLIVETSNVKEWGKPGGFKDRNIRIAQKADYVYSISTHIKKDPCYHCIIRNHERTGGCWTLKHAVKIGKHGEAIII